MLRIAPCIWTDTKADEAAALHTSLLPGGQIVCRSTYGERMPLPAGTTLVAEYMVGGLRFQALNGGPIFRPNPSISFFLHVDTAAEVDALHARLAEGSRALMPLDTYPWSPRYAWIEDRFGVSWQLMAGRRPASGASVSTCLMFSGPRHLRAAEAIAHYTGLFGGTTESVELYRPGAAPPEAVGGVMHGRFTLAGQSFVAMDSHVSHDITFTEGVSLSVACADQAEIDRLWDALCEGGHPGRCGWLTDRFGVSWQIVPESLGALQARGDVAANGRMFAALMGMDRLDAAALERAYRGA